MSHTLVHNEAECKYEYHIGEHIAYITYAEDENGHMHITHTVVPDALSGQGLARTLLEDVLEEFKKQYKGEKDIVNFSILYILKKIVEGQGIRIQ